MSYCTNLYHKFIIENSTNLLYRVNATMTPSSSGLVAWVRVFYFYIDTCRKYQPTLPERVVSSRTQIVITGCSTDPCLCVDRRSLQPSPRNQITTHWFGLGGWKSCRCWWPADCKANVCLFLKCSIKRKEPRRQLCFAFFMGLAYFLLFTLVSTDCDWYETENG